jgi:uncharacterized protein YecE (DUF72 family)
LPEYLIGAGGWAYFKVPGLNPLVAYSKAFNFVEVNSTFYEIPPLKDVERWRSIVPHDFQFTVRAHRSLTHTLKLESTSEVFETFDVMKQICKLLNANILHLQTPPSLSKSPAFSGKLHDFLDSVNLGELRLALETRGARASKLPVELVNVMQDHDVVHCVDLSKGEMPAYDSNVLYSRLFGKGYHNVYQPTDKELKEIDKKALSKSFQKMVLSFHFGKMYKDAARLKIYKQTGRFPKITKSEGLASLEEILKEDAEFPSSKQELISDQGWKLFDMTEDNRVRAKEYLQRLPEGTYNSINDVMDALHSAME